MFACSKWFICLFATYLSQETVLRVWDLLLVDGIEVIFQS